MYKRQEQTFRADEARHGLIYGIAERLATNPEYFVAAPYLATVHEAGQLAAAALMTPPHNLLVVTTADDPNPAFTLMARNLIDDGWQVRGVNGLSAWSHAFAHTWHTLTGATPIKQMELGVFELRQVFPPANVPGFMRPATEAELDLIVDWYATFQIDAHINEAPPLPENVLRRIHEQSIYLWEHNGPVSLAAQGRRTHSSISVGPVFTPAALRGRGYASACVAALSQLILDEGWAFCTLFTDLANPTSNKIYQQVGYRPVCEFTDIRFTHPA